MKIVLIRALNHAKDRQGKSLLGCMEAIHSRMYADPIKCRSEFEMILKNNSGSYRKILQEALEQDLPSTKSSRAKGSASKSKDKKSNQTQSDSHHSTKSDGSQRKLRQGNSPVREAKGKTSMGNKMLKNLEAHDSKADGQARKRASDQNGTSSKTKLKRNANDIEKKGSKSSGQDKARSLSPGTEKKMKRKQDKTRENVKQRVPSAEKVVKKKSNKQDEEQKALVLDKKRQRSKPIEVQNKVKRQKQNGILNDDDLIRQSPEINSLGKSQELSARRVRVMKSLGLIAPPGSPFHNGHIYNGSY